MTAPDPGVECLDEFDEAEEMSSAFCPQMTEEEYEKQTSEATEKALNVSVASFSCCDNVSGLLLLLTNPIKKKKKTSRSWCYCYCVSSPVICNNCIVLYLIHVIAILCQ